MTSTREQSWYSIVNFHQNEAQKCKCHFGCISSNTVLTKETINHDRKFLYLFWLFTHKNPNQIRRKLCPFVYQIQFRRNKKRILSVRWSLILLSSLYSLGLDFCVAWTEIWTKIVIQNCSTRKYTYCTAGTRTSSKPRRYVSWCHMFVLVYKKSSEINLVWMNLLTKSE